MSFRIRVTGYKNWSEKCGSLCLPWFILVSLMSTPHVINYNLWYLDNQPVSMDVHDPWSSKSVLLSTISFVTILNY